MEAFPKSVPTSSDESVDNEDQYERDSFFDSSDDERNMVEITDGKHMALISARLMEFKKILSEQDYTVSRDRLDIKVELKKSQTAAEKKSNDEVKMIHISFSSIFSMKNKD